jgi:hypothetical protein
MSTKVKAQGQIEGIAADKALDIKEEEGKKKKDEEGENEEEEDISQDEGEEEAEDDAEEEEDEIIDLDDLGGDDLEVNKRNSQKEINQIDGLKENLNTQITGTMADNRIETTDRKTGGPLCLQNLDVNTVPKEEIVNFLLNNKELFGSCSSLDLDVMVSSPFKSERKKRNNKYNKVESSFKQNKIKPNYILSNSMEIGNPEMTYDFRTACNRVADGNADKSLKLLVTKKAMAKTKNLEASKRDHIATKVDFYISKKTKKIENIKDKMDEDNFKGCTFRPVTNNPVNSETKRPLEEFLTFQSNHLKKVQEAVKGMKEEGENKKIEEFKPPTIDKVIKY